MARTPEQCRYRVSAPLANGSTAFSCDLVRQIAGVEDQAACQVQRDACEACCRRSLPSAATPNPVVASLVYGLAASVVDRGGVPGCDVAQAMRAQQHVVGSLEIVAANEDRHDVSSSRFRAPGSPEHSRATSPPARRPGRLVWAVGLVTAPRPEPTIQQTLASLRDAGFTDVHVFAEPGSWIPEESGSLPVTVHGAHLGNIGQFCTALTELYMAQPHADCYAVFQDDVAAARGLKDWCDEQFWPLRHGLVSLYTSRVHSGDSVGWHVLDLGFYRTFGALAFVFRHDVLQEFLTDGQVLRYRQRHAHGDDSLVGEWANRYGIGIAYHTPSLVQHTGKVSSLADHDIGRVGFANAVHCVDQIPRWRPPRKQYGRIGLVGWNTPTGLGYANRDIAAYLPIEKWLVPKHPELRRLPRPKANCRVDYAPLTLSSSDLKAWARGLDWVLFVETPYFGELPQLVRQLGNSVACVPTWEYLSLQLGWTRIVDLMICPTIHTYKLVSQWKRRFGFAWDVVYVPWPVDARRFRFRRREMCRRFLFVNGTGGTCGRRPDGSLTAYHRKGIEVLLEAASMLPEIPFTVCSQTDHVPAAPPNVTLCRPAAKNVDLYRHGDVCVQPSHWEGIGLQLLECQAAGLPLVTTDAPPMNEYQPLRAIPVAGTEVVSVFGNHPITSNNIDPAVLAKILEGLYETDIEDASLQARDFIVREHSWKKAGCLLGEKMVR